MSTNNFITQTDFDLYVTVYKYPDEEAAKADWLEYCFANDIVVNSDDFDYDNWVDKDCYNYYDLEYDNLNWLLKDINSKLNYFQIELESGYYDGIQTLIKPQKYWSDIYSNFDDLIEHYDNYDFKWYFNDCKSITSRKIKSEINKINNKYLPYLKNNSSLRHIVKIGGFSNGEAIYSEVA